MDDAGTVPVCVLVALTEALVVAFMVTVGFEPSDNTEGSGMGSAILLQVAP